MSESPNLFFLNPTADFHALANGAKLFGMADAQAELKAPRNLEIQVAKAVPGLFANLLLHGDDQLGEDLQNRLGMAIIKAAQMSGREPAEKSAYVSGTAFTKARVNQVAAERVTLRYIAICSQVAPEQEQTLRKITSAMKQIGSLESKLAIVDPNSNLVLYAKFEERIAKLKAKKKDITLQSVLLTAEEIAFPKKKGGQLVQSAIPFMDLMTRLHAAEFSLPQTPENEKVFKLIEKTLLFDRQGKSLTKTLAEFKKKNRLAEIAMDATETGKDERTSFIESPVETNLPRSVFVEKIVSAVRRSNTYGTDNANEAFAHYNIVERITGLMGNRSNEIVHPAWMYQDVLSSISKVLCGGNRRYQDPSDNRRLARALIEATYFLFTPETRQRLEMNPKLAGQAISLQRTEQRFLEANLMPAIVDQGKQPQTASEGHVLIQPSKTTSVSLGWDNKLRPRVPLSTDAKTKAKLRYNASKLPEDKGYLVFVDKDKQWVILNDVKEITATKSKKSKAQKK